jgi:CheY-like chemotaxis protein
VVDDDLASNDLARRLLERDGWRIRTASNGREALRSVQEQLPALIVLDLMMPEMDGFSFSETLRTDPRLSQIPIVVLTSKSLTPEDHRRLNGQVNDILLKGSTSRLDLLATVRRLAGPSPLTND